MNCSRSGEHIEKKPLLRIFTLRPTEKRNAMRSVFLLTAALRDGLIVMVAVFFMASLIVMVVMAPLVVMLIMARLMRVAIARRIGVAIPVVADKIHRAAAGVVSAAVSAPVALLS